MAKLRTGVEVPDIAVETTISRLEDLKEEHPLVFRELVYLCRDENHYVNRTAREYLQELRLVDFYCDPSIILRKIVLAAVVGDWPGMNINSPYTEEAQSKGKAASIASGDLTHSTFKLPPETTFKPLSRGRYKCNQTGVIMKGGQIKSYERMRANAR